MFPPKLYLLLKDAPEPDVHEVGGKGHFLMRMARAGLPVPAGFVLAPDFFEPWVKKVKKTSVWEEFTSADFRDWTLRAEPLKRLALNLALDDQQKEILSAAVERMGQVTLFAVRPSAPKEDLEAASFAGGYETVLGVTTSDLEKAIRRVFASWLDPRVLVYKKERGLNPANLRAAVIVQTQIASDVAGMGVTVNPVTNDFDEAVINANWGLGASVVSGRTSPDQFVVDQVGRRIIETRLGDKEVSVWLKADGGTEERSDVRRGILCLTQDQVLELADFLARIEELSGRPMDVEWAYAQERPYILQTKPLTGYVPLPREMQTEPGGPRRLYHDLTLSEGGLLEPLSVMGTRFLNDTIRDVSIQAFGEDRFTDVAEGLVFAAGGRMYLNVSNALHLENKERIAEALMAFDTITADILAHIDENRFKTPVKPKKLKGLEFRALFRVPDVVGKVVQAAVWPDQLEARYSKEIQKFLDEVLVRDDLEKNVKELADLLLSRNVRLLLHIVIPTMVAVLVSRRTIRRMFAKEAEKDEALKRQLDRIEQGLPNNMAVEMGLELYHLSQKLNQDEYDAVEDLERRYNIGRLPAEFKLAWDGFMKKYGFRGPREMDVAAPRYAEMPELLLAQIFSLLISSTPEINPEVLWEKSQRESQQTLASLTERARTMGWTETKKLKWAYNVLKTFGGYRENSKYFLIMVNFIMRRRLMAEAETLTWAERLDSPEQIFDLTLDDLVRGLEDENVDFRAMAEENTVFYRQLKFIRRFPRMIDSRGRIHRFPRPPLKEGELAGRPLSQGLVTGRVKVIRYPGEKPLEPGEILVARATDPGWVPLFVNAGAIVLEVGGMLQHGALVAREFGKPCIAGVQDASSLLKDGDLVEVDGAAGIIRPVQCDPS